MTTQRGGGGGGGAIGELGFLFNHTGASPPDYKEKKQRRESKLTGGDQNMPYRGTPITTKQLRGVQVQRTKKTAVRLGGIVLVHE